ncbi:MAG: hypothetical protein COW08_02575 [Ignavibacteriales bacterium CG12_big_fil_rev_8_21_14_0_65_30_8]|nr:MAG: hypothetical protein COW08_02575 [Ignavibacteriales bacterium CG12_big_fil_rev_8_21_14_0_65_30_8]
MILTLYVTDNCKACERVKNQLKSLLQDRKDVTLFIENIIKKNIKNILIVPALYIDEELYVLGDINEEKFLNRLKNI